MWNEAIPKPLVLLHEGNIKQTLELSGTEQTVSVDCLLMLVLSWSPEPCLTFALLLRLPKLSVQNCLHTQLDTLGYLTHWHWILASSLADTYHPYFFLFVYFGLCSTGN